jgi:hypothetical protein
LYIGVTLGGWNRIRVISPPEDSPFSDISSGFGCSLGLDGETLIIGASKQIVNLRNNFDDCEQRLFPFCPTGIRNIRFAGAVYQTTVDEISPLQRIDIPREGSQAAGSVAAAGGNISFGVIDFSASDPFSGYTVLISKGRTHFLKSRGSVVMGDKYTAFISDEQDKILLFNSQSLDDPPQEVIVPFLARSFALSDNFIAVNNGFVPGGTNRSLDKAQSFVVRLKDGANCIIEEYGKIALNNCFLVFSFDYEYIYPSQGHLKIFSLNDMTNPKLIREENDGIKKAKLTDNFLVTTRTQLSNYHLIIPTSHPIIYIDRLPE